MKLNLDSFFNTKIAKHFKTNANAHLQILTRPN